MSAVCGVCGAVRVPTRAAGLSSARADPTQRQRSGSFFDSRIFEGIVRPNPATIHRMFDMIRSSPHVSDNQLHSERARSSALHVCFKDVDPTGPRVYSTASGVFRCEHCAEPGPKAASAVIVMPSAFFTFVGLLSIYVGAPLLLDRGVARNSVAKHRIAECAEVLRSPDQLQGSTGRSLEARARRAAADAGVLPIARDIADGASLIVLAHELGHWAYGHIAGPKGSFEVSRNNERDADSFAASVVATLSSPDRALLGGVMFWCCLAKFDRQLTRGDGDEHPAPVARLDAMLAAMPSALAALLAGHGLGADDLRGLAE